MRKLFNWLVKNGLEEIQQQQFACMMWIQIYNTLRQKLSEHKVCCLQVFETAGGECAVIEVTVFWAVSLTLLAMVNIAHILTI